MSNWTHDFDSQRHHQPRGNIYLKAVGWTITLLLGAFLGFGLSVFQNPITVAVRETVCQGSSNLKAGKTARRAAVELYLDANGAPEGENATAMSQYHREANDLFKRSASCGFSEATVYLAQAYCFGWEVPHDPQRGWRMIGEAIQTDATSIAVVTAASDGDIRRFCPEI